MSTLKYKAIRAAFEFFSLAGLNATIRHFSACDGVIFTMHRVLPEAPAAFAPNSLLQVTPDFLESVILRARELGFDIISLDEAIARLGRKTARPFVVLTFDDAYRDNLHHALPILRKHKAPFTLYVPTGLVDGEGELWWQALEDMIADNDQIDAGELGGMMDVSTIALKNKAFADIYWNMRDISESARVAQVKTMAATHGFDLKKHCRELVMNWDELCEFAEEPLCTIGAHTIRHYELSHLPEAEARAEMGGSARILKERFGRVIKHFCYPIGSLRAAADREYQLANELGFVTGVTTRPGGLYGQNLDKLHALPRISLNGYYQEKRFIDTFLTGELFTLFAKRR